MCLCAWAQNDFTACGGVFYILIFSLIFMIIEIIMEGTVYQNTRDLHETDIISETHSLA